MLNCACQWQGGNVFLQPSTSTRRSYAPVEMSFQTFNDGAHLSSFKNASGPLSDSFTIQPRSRGPGIQDDHSSPATPPLTVGSRSASSSIKSCETCDNSVQPCMCPDLSDSESLRLCPSKLGYVETLPVSGSKMHDRTRVARNIEYVQADPYRYNSTQNSPRVGFLRQKQQHRSVVSSYIQRKDNTPSVEFDRTKEPSLTSGVNW